jgi:hypothetical protein
MKNYTLDELVSMVSRFRSKLDQSGVVYQSLGQVKGDTIYIFAKKQHVDQIKSVLYGEDLSVVRFMDSSVD